MSDIVQLPIYGVRLYDTGQVLRVPIGNVDHTEAAAEVLHHFIGHEDREHFVCLFLNASKDITGVHTGAVGAQSSIGGIDPRACFRAAILACASAMIVGHNHPSGVCMPSAEDITMTLSLSVFARAVDIPVLDHVIVTRYPNCYYSMFHDGKMP